ncbi:hypothetical protein PGTUg99_032430 [Puccinia graminis f. sp. tritici]|uniref:Uncharacterized protein n=1 Tax=Puccinia graminis f. sp. tritici TaxID=56615 RepID=A0A5B0RXN0_PUCGR|nr:hypothetical protein PGTUg99_032430 [Puccinia graminis f. sp. tritici]
MRLPYAIDDGPDGYKSQVRHHGSLPVSTLVAIPETKLITPSGISLEYRGLDRAAINEEGLLVVK